MHANWHERSACERSPGRSVKVRDDSCGWLTGALLRFVDQVQLGLQQPRRLPNVLNKLNGVSWMSPGNDVWDAQQVAEIGCEGLK